MPRHSSAAKLAVQPATATLAELVSSLSFALDLTEGQPPGHAERTAALALRLAAALGLNHDDRRNLYYAALLKDAGCSSNAARMCQLLGSDEIAAKRAVKLVNWREKNLASVRYAWQHVRTGQAWWRRLGGLADRALHQKRDQREVVAIRCERGAEIVQRMGFPSAVGHAIRALDEHWDGRGYPEGLTGGNIPLLGRVLCLAQTMQVFTTEHGWDSAMAIARQRSGTWFDPELVHTAAGLTPTATDPQRWPEQFDAPVDSCRLDHICEAFAGVVDAKSPYTYHHSQGVAAAAVQIGAALNLPESTLVLLRRAGLLHDLGKLGVPNTILEKRGPLTDEEWTVMRRHPQYTHEILRRITGFGELAEVASQHHERLDGTGYWRGLTAEQLSLPARILMVADVYDALAADRPYRRGLPHRAVFRILWEDTPRALDRECVAALAAVVGHTPDNDE